MALLWAGTPTTAERPEAGLRCGLAMSGDLRFSAASRPDADPALRRGVDEVLSREENEEESKDPYAYAITPDHLDGVIRVPQPASHSPRDHASALRPVGLALPLRC